MEWGDLWFSYRAEQERWTPKPLDRPAVEAQTAHAHQVDRARAPSGRGIPRRGQVLQESRARDRTVSGAGRDRVSTASGVGSLMTGPAGRSARRSPMRCGRHDAAHAQPSVRASSVAWPATAP